MRIAFVALSARGHLYPTTALARQLQSRNHELIPINLGLPYVHVSNALHFDYSGYTPLCLYDWPHEATPAALARNREGVANIARMLKQH